MQPQAPQADSTSIDGVFYLIGFLSCLALTVFDFYTSFTGIRAFASPEASNVWRTYLPAVMSGVAITFVACSTIIIERFVAQQSPKTILMMVCFLVSVIYDLVSSFLGTVAGMMNIESSIEAFHKASQELIVFSAVAASLMMLGSFLLSKWFHLLKTCPGVIGDFFRKLGG
jgi:hypothetical protein